MFVLSTLGAPTTKYAEGINRGVIAQGLSKAHQADEQILALDHHRPGGNSDDPGVGKLTSGHQLNDPASRTCSTLWGCRHLILFSNYASWWEHVHCGSQELLR